MPSKKKGGLFTAVDWLVGAGSPKDVIVIAVDGERKAV